MEFGNMSGNTEAPRIRQAFEKAGVYGGVDLDVLAEKLAAEGCYVQDDISNGPAVILLATPDEAYMRVAVEALGSENRRIRERVQAELDREVGDLAHVLDKAGIGQGRIGQQIIDVKEVAERLCVLGRIYAPRV